MMKVLHTTSSSGDFTSLTDLLDKELWERYPDDQASYEGYNKLQHSDTVVVGYLQGVPIACGCFKPRDPQTAEIKRMFVRKEHRGKGFAFVLLHALEQWAKEKKFTRTVLETGVNQPEAIALYEKAGYKRIPNFPPYVDMPLSVCMEKKL